MKNSEIGLLLSALTIDHFPWLEVVEDEPESAVFKPVFVPDANIEVKVQIRSTEKRFELNIIFGDDIPVTTALEILNRTSITATATNLPTSIHTVTSSRGIVELIALGMDIAVLLNVAEKHLSKEKAI